MVNFHDQDVDSDVPPLPPPAYCSENDEDLVTSDSAASAGSLDTPAFSRRSASQVSEALNAKRQETACAVSQMRDRLRAMGLLDKTVSPPAPPTAEEAGVPPPPPPMASEVESAEARGGGEGEADAGEDSEADTVGENDEEDKDETCGAGQHSGQDSADTSPDAAQEEYRALLKYESCYIMLLCMPIKHELMCRCIVAADS